MADRELKVIISGDPSSLNKAFKSASDHSSKLGTSLKTLGKVAAVGVGAAFAGFAAVLKVGFDELSDGQKVMAQTQAALKSTGSAANVTAPHVAGLDPSMSKMSGVDDELIQTGENLLLTFKNVRNEVGKGNNVFDQATEAALDLSVAGFGSVESASKMMGKALNDPIKGMTALGRAGVTFSEAQKKVIKGLVDTGDLLGAQKIILKEVQSQVGGSAKAYGETLPGQLSKLRNSFEELAAKVATAVLPALMGVVEFLNRNMPTIEAAVGRAVEVVSKFAGKLVDIATPVVQSAITNLVPVFENLGHAIEHVVEVAQELVPVFLRMGSSIASVGFSTTGQSLAAAAGSMIIFHAAAERVVGTLVKLRAAAVAASMSSLIGPIGIATAAVGALAFAFIAMKLDSDNTSEALDRQRDALDALREAADASTHAHQRAVDANISLKQATLDITAAIKNRNRLFADGKKGTDEYTQAQLNVQRAYANRKRAEQEVKESTDGVTKSTRDNSSAIKRLNTDFATLTEKALSAQVGLTRMPWKQKDLVDKYAGGLLALAREAQKVADKTKETNPRISEAAREFSKTATQAANLAKKTGEIPTKMELAAAGAGPAGRRIGTALGQGIKAGIDSQVGAIAAAAANAVTAAENAARSRAKAKSPSELFAELGRDISEGMRKGMIEKYALLREAGQAAVDNVISATVARIQARKSDFSNAFSTLVSSALSAFDALHEGVKTAAEKALDAFDLRQAKLEAEKRIRELRDDLKKASDELTGFQAAGPEQVTQKEGESPEDFAARQLAAQKDFIDKQTQLTEQRNAAQVALDDELEAQRLAKQRAGLEKRAELSRQKEDDQTALERYQFEKRLTALQNAAQGGHITQKEFLTRLHKLYKDFDIPMKDRGNALGLAIAAGLNDAEKAVQQAAEKLVQLVRDAFQNLKIVVDVEIRGQQQAQHRARGGPVNRNQPYLVGEQGAEVFVPRTAGRIIPNGGGGAATAGGTYVFNFPNYVGDQRDLERIMQSVMRRFENSNGVSFTGRPI